jgi:hypothetical protein
MREDFKTIELKFEQAIKTLELKIEQAKSENSKFMLTGFMAIIGLLVAVLFKLQ